VQGEGKSSAWRRKESRENEKIKKKEQGAGKISRKRKEVIENESELCEGKTARE